MFYDKHNHQLSKIQTLRLFELPLVKGTRFLLFKGLHLEGAAVRAEVICRWESTGVRKPATQTASQRSGLPEPRCSEAAALWHEPEIAFGWGHIQICSGKTQSVSRTNCSLLMRFELMNKYSPASHKPKNYSLF